MAVPCTYGWHCSYQQKCLIILYVPQLCSRICTSTQGGLRHRPRCAGKPAVTSLDHAAAVPTTTSGPPNSRGWSLGSPSPPSPWCCAGGRRGPCEPCGCSSSGASCNRLGCNARVLGWRRCCRPGPCRLSAVRSSSSGLQPAKAQARMMPTALRGFTRGIDAAPARLDSWQVGLRHVFHVFEPRAKRCKNRAQRCQSTVGLAQ